MLTEMFALSGEKEWAARFVSITLPASSVTLLGTWSVKNRWQER
jgi:hypothetical protein